MSDLDARTRALFDEAAPFEEPSPADRARIQAKLVKRVGGGVFTAAATIATSSKVAASAGAGASAAGMGLFGKTLATLVVVGAVGGGAAYGVHAYHARVDHRSPTGPSSAHAAPVQRPSDPAEPESTRDLSPRDPPATASASPATRGPAKAARSAGPSAAPSASFSEELALVGEAQRALRDGDPARALELTERHAALYPRGQLAEERDGVRVLAMCALGRPDAPAQALRFVRSHPNAPLTGRVRGACKLP